MEEAVRLRRRALGERHLEVADSPGAAAAECRRPRADRAYLEGRPVIARQDTLGYRTRKFIGRNKLSVALAAVMTAIVLGFAVTMALLAAQIARERDRVQVESAKAEQVVSFLVGLFRSGDPHETRGASVTVDEILHRGAKQVSEKLSEQPAVQAAMCHTLAEVHQNLGLSDRARPLRLIVLKDGLFEVPTRRRPEAGRHGLHLHSWRQTAYDCLHDLHKSQKARIQCPNWAAASPIRV